MKFALPPMTEHVRSWQTRTRRGVRYPVAIEVIADISQRLPNSRNL